MGEPGSTEQLPAAPDYYKRVIVQDRDGKKAVAATPIKAFGEGLFLAIEVDKNNLPVPNLPANMVSFTNLGSKPDLTPTISQETPPQEQYFGLGITAPSLGIYDMKDNRFISFRDEECHTRTGANNWNELVVAGLKEPLGPGEQPKFADLVSVASALVERDWPATSNRHSANQLASSATRAVLKAFYQTGLFAYRPHEGPIEQNPFYAELEKVISNPDMIERIRQGDPHNFPGQEEYLSKLREYCSEDLHGGIKPYIQDVLKVSVLPHAEKTLSQHAEEISKLDNL